MNESIRRSRANRTRAYLRTTGICLPPLLLRRIATATAVGMSLLVSSAHGASVGDRLDRVLGPFETSVIATGLKSPGGLAFHPQTGELYATDETGGMVYVIRDGQNVPALSPNWAIEDDIPEWAITPTQSKAYWLQNRLRMPEDIAFSKEGHLFVAEDIANGRILEFIPNVRGEYDTARAIPVPWMNKAYEWESVVVARDGRLFIAGSTSAFGPGLLFGSILMRDPEGIWWAIDYAPFASFSALALSRDEEILVTGEEFPGAVTWWDLDRRRDVGDVAQRLPNVEGLAVLTDGTIIAVQESQTAGTGDLIPGLGEPSSGGRLLMIDPETREISVLAEGFGTIEGIVAAPDTGYLYVTEDSTGLVLELRPTRALAGNEYKLKRSLQEFEILHGYAPKRWPDFLRNFMDQIGVETSDRDMDDETDPADVAREGREEQFGAGLTLQEFAHRVPLIAGKIQAEVLPGTETEDPIVELQFLSFFPNHVVTVQERTMPSVSMMSATRQSGHVERTRLVNNYAVSKRLSSGEYTGVSEGADLYMPLTTCSAVQFGNVLNLLLSYVGVGNDPDFHIQLACGAVPKGRLMVERGRGNRELYDLRCIDYTQEGHRVMNFVVAGINPRREDGIEWLELGKQPTPRLVTLSDPTEAGWVSRWIARRSPQLHDMVAKNREQQMRAFDHYLENPPQPGEMARPPRFAPDERPPSRFDRAVEEPPPSASSEDPAPGAPILSEEAPPPDGPRLSEDQPEGGPRLTRDPAPRDPLFSKEDSLKEDAVSEAEPPPESGWDELLLTRAVRAFEGGFF